MTSLYDRIELLCKEKQITITDMSKLTSTSRASFSDLKVGRKKTLASETISKISEFFEVPMDFFLGNGVFRYWDEIDENRLSFFQTVLDAGVFGASDLLTQFQIDVLYLFSVKPSSLIKFLNQEIESATRLDHENFLIVFKRDNLSGERPTDHARSLARLSCTQLTKDEDDKIASFIDFILSQRPS